MAKTCAVSIYMNFTSCWNEDAVRTTSSAETWENRGPAVLRVTGFESTRIGCRSRVNWDLDVLILAFEDDSKKGIMGQNPIQTGVRNLNVKFTSNALPPRVGPVWDVCFKIDFPARGLLRPVGKAANLFN